VDRETSKVEAEKKVFKMNEELQQAKAQYDQVQKDIDTAEGAKKQLEAQRDNIDDQIEAEKKARVRTEGQKRQLSTEAEELKGTLEASDIGKGDIEIQNLQLKRNEFRKQLDFELANKDRAEDAKREADREIIAVKLKVESYAKDKQTNEAKKQEKEDELVIVKGNLQDETKLRERAEENLEKSEKELDEVQKQISAGGNKGTDEAQQIIQLDSEAKKLRSKLDQDSSAKKTGEADKRKCEDIINSLRDKHRRQEDAFAKFKEEAAKETSAKKKIEEKLVQAVATFGGKIDDL